MISYDVCFVGGGATGFFSAINLCSQYDCSAAIFEKGPHYLSKVKISGGGRCNVTHHQYDPMLLIKNYPRGEKELISPFHQFQPEDTWSWFQERGVPLKIEEDGRIFPKSNQSQSIIDCFLKETDRFNIQKLPKTQIKKITYHPEDTPYVFHLQDQKQTLYQSKAVMLATGSFPASYDLASGLGHSITDLAPSLFTFKIKDPRISGLSGISLSQAQISLKIQTQNWNFKGPILITHHGLSGPVVLKLSAFAARELKKVNYKATIKVNWSGLEKKEVMLKLKEQQRSTSDKLVSNTPLFNIPKRLWVSLLKNYKDQRWKLLSDSQVDNITHELFSTEFHIQGINRFKEEFVECGGVNLKEIHFKTMESKIVPGLFLGGELLDIDGVTGGFNFQNAWTTGHIASLGISDYLSSL